MDFIFTYAKGRHIGYLDNIANNTPANSGMTLALLKTAEGDESLRDYTNLGALLAGASVECDFTNYARIDLTDTDGISVTINTTTNKVAVGIPNQSIAAAGGTLDNTMAKLVICYNPDITSDVDANIIPLYAMDFVATTNGTTLGINVDAAGLIDE